MPNKSCNVYQVYAQRFTMSGPLHPTTLLGVDLMQPLRMTRRKNVLKPLMK